MSETLFEKIKERAGDQQRSVGWYRKNLRYLAADYHNKPIQQLLTDEKADKLTDEKFQDSNMSRKMVRKGHLYLFEYKATTKYLRWYDTYPLVYVVDRTHDYFIGCNLHYINPKYRMKIIETLTKEDILNVPRDSFHKYLVENVKSGRYLDLGIDEWMTAVMLPIDNFVYIKNNKQFDVKKQEVWDDSYNKRNKRVRIKRTIELYPDQRYSDGTK